MMVRLILSFILILPCLFNLRTASAGMPAPLPLEKIKIIRHQSIPMRDGIKLYGDVYLPDVAGKFPTLVTRTPYGVQRDAERRRDEPLPVPGR